MRNRYRSISRRTAVALFTAMGCGGEVSTLAKNSSHDPRGGAAGADASGVPMVPASGGSLARGSGGQPPTGDGGKSGAGPGGGGADASASGAPSSGGQGPVDTDGGPVGTGGAVQPQPGPCEPLVEAGSLFPNASCGVVQRGNLPAGDPAPQGSSGPIVVSGGGIVIMQRGPTGATSHGIHAFDRSGRCFLDLGAEGHSFNRYAGVGDAQFRSETAAVLVDCDSDQGPCGSTLYINGTLALDLTRYPVDPIESSYSRIAVNLDGKVLVVTDTSRIGRDTLHRARLVSRSGEVLNDVSLPADRFWTSAVAADQSGRYVIALVGQPQAGQARSALEVLDGNLARVTFLPLREDIEVNALWADSPDTVIAVGQEGSPDPYGYVEAFSIPDLRPVWPVHPRFPLGYAHAVDVGTDGLVWVVGDDPNDVIWLAAFDPVSTGVTIVPSPAPVNDYPFSKWSLSVLADGTVLFAHDSLYSYCR